MTQSTISQRDAVELEPNKLNRWIVFLSIGALVITLGTLFVPWLGDQFFPGNSIIRKIGIAIGFFGSVAIMGLAAEKYFFIRNGTTAIFVTQDIVRSIRGEKKLNIAYGPGLHICFPWERRIAENNILIEDAAIAFEFTVQREDGTISGSGSYRMRPDETNPVSFLASAASIGKEIADLIIGEIQNFYKEEGALEALGKLGELNDHLKKVFVSHDPQHIGTLEENNGVMISDVTVSKLVPSDELQRTLASISEARALNRAVLAYLGLNSNEELNAALNDGTLTQLEVKRAREAILATSGNMDNLKINRTEFDLNITGLDPEAAKAITALLGTPGAAAAAASLAQKGGGKKS